MVGWFRAAVDDTVSADSGDSGDEFPTYDSVRSGLQKIVRTTLRCNVFVDLFMTAPSRTPTFESIFERGPRTKLSKSLIPREAVPQKSKKRRAIALAARHPSLTAVSQRLPEINMLKMGAIPGKDYHTGPTAPILSMLISCVSQRLRYGLTAPRDYAYISQHEKLLCLNTRRFLCLTTRRFSGQFCTSIGQVFLHKLIYGER